MHCQESIFKYARSTKLTVVDRYPPTQKMSSSSSTRRTSASSNYSSPSSRIASRNTPSPSGVRPAPVGPMNRQVGVRTATRGTPSRDVRSQQMSEQRSPVEQMSNESLQEVPIHCEELDLCHFSSASS